MVSLTDSNLDEAITAEELRKTPVQFIQSLTRPEKLLLLHRYHSFDNWEAMEQYYRRLVSGKTFKPWIPDNVIKRDMVSIAKIKSYEAGNRIKLKAYIAEPLFMD